MTEHIPLAQGTKEEQYQQLLPQIKALISGEQDLIANLANITAVLKTQFNWHWVGFYLVKNEELVLGPFQGPVACTRIQKGKGVCGTVWNIGCSLIVPDVHQFPGHIACSSLTESEIVIPLLHNGIVWGVLDIDSVKQNDFDAIDQQYLEACVALIVRTAH